jgi:hypothetical protein
LVPVPTFKKGFERTSGSSLQDFETFYKTFGPVLDLLPSHFMNLGSLFLKPTS